MKRRILLACLAARRFRRRRRSRTHFCSTPIPAPERRCGRRPKRVVLVFSEKLEPVFSGVAVTDASGRQRRSGPVVIGGKSMVAPLRPLPPGRYRVSWHVVSVDTHRTEGAYSFTVKP